MPEVRLQEPASSDWFVQEFLRHQARIYGVIMSVIYSRDDAEDIFQSVSMTLWRKQADFDPQQGSFAGWAVGIARNHIRNYLREQKRKPGHVVFTEKLVDQLLETESVSAKLIGDERSSALQNCLSKLQEKQRKLLELFYGRRQSTTELAEAIGIARKTLYRRIDRIRAALQECVSRRLEGTISG